MTPTEVAHAYVSLRPSEPAGSDGARRRAIAEAVEAASAALTEIVDLRVEEGECDLLGTEPDEVDSLREFAHFRRLCVALELGRFGGAGGDVRPGFFVMVLQ